MKRDFTLYLKDIFEAINFIEEFIRDMSFDEFKKDEKTSSATVRKLEIIGEATKHIPKEVIDANKEIPWKEMAGMRDKTHFLRILRMLTFRWTIKATKSSIFPSSACHARAAHPKSKRHLTVHRV